MSDSTEISRAVVKKQIQTTNSSNDVSANSTNFFDNRYYTINKRLLSIVGQWPYQSDLEQRLRFVFVCLISTSLLVPQVGQTMIIALVCFLDLMNIKKLCIYVNYTLNI